MSEILKPGAQGIVHSTPGRTRLRVPADYREHKIMHNLELALQQVSGVKYAETNERTGSIVVYHEDTASVLQSIGEAIGNESQQLFNLMVAPRAEQPMTGGGFISILSGKLTEAADAATPAIANETAARTIKRWLPFAFVVAGLVKFLETESLLAGVSPLVLFYYAFDSHWKFRGEPRTEVGQLQEGPPPQAGDIT